MKTRTTGQLLATTLLLLAGCPGSATLPAGDGTLGPLPDGPKVIVSDGKPPSPAETGAPPSDATASTTPGGPCPCASPLLCVMQACRQPCQEQPCNGPSSCGAGEACIRTESGTPVCVPGAGTGQACSSTTFCTAANLCLSAGGSTAGRCYATCTGSGSPCGNCTAIPGSSCSYCP